MSEKAQTRGFGDSGRPRGAAQLAADVRDVPVNGVRAEHQLLGDLAIAEAPRDAGENLALPIGQQYQRRLVGSPR